MITCLIGNACAFPNSRNVQRAGNDPIVPQGYLIIDRQSGDVNGDGKSDNVFLIGHKPDVNSDFTDDLSVMVQDGVNTDNTTTMKLPDLGGYNCKLFIGDFSGDKVGDVLVSVPTGGSGGIVDHRVITFRDGPRDIFGSSENRGIKLSGKFIEHFKAEITELLSKRKIVIDLSNKKDTYITGNVYTEQGNLAKSVTIQDNAFSALEPLDIDKDGVFELRGTQRLTGIANADTVGIVYSIWKYEREHWVVKQVEVATFIVAYGEKIL